MSLHTNRSIPLLDGSNFVLSERTEAAIAESASKYSAPLWECRDENQLKLGGHQWILPESLDAARALLAQNPQGIRCLAWKLFGRRWQTSSRIALIDEDKDNKHCGWVLVQKVSNPAADWAVFVEFLLVELV